MTHRPTILVTGAAGFAGSHLLDLLGAEEVRVVALRKPGVGAETQAAYPTVTWMEIDLLALAYARTFKMPVVVTRCSNNYGPYQFPEKLIPLMIANAIRDLPLPVYGDGMNVRDWIHVEDHGRGLLAALEKGEDGHVYNFGASSERHNIDIVKQVLRLVGKPESLIKYVKDRPGHDRRYAIDSAKARARLGWAPRHVFEDALAATVRWYVERRPWWERIISGEYLKYYERQYGARA